MQRAAARLLACISDGTVNAGVFEPTDIGFAASLSTGLGRVRASSAIHARHVTMKDFSVAAWREAPPSFLLGLADDYAHCEDSVAAFEALICHVQVRAALVGAPGADEDSPALPFTVAHEPARSCIRVTITLLGAAFLGSEIVISSVKLAQEEILRSPLRVVIGALHAAAPGGRVTDAAREGLDVVPLLQAGNSTEETDEVRSICDVKHVVRLSWIN
jgi:hypothetical protein